MNREQRYALAHRALEVGIEENANGKVILVEGQRDEAALRSLGFTGPIEKLFDRWMKRNIFLSRPALVLVEPCALSQTLLTALRQKNKVLTNIKERKRDQERGKLIAAESGQNVQNRNSQSRKSVRDAKSPQQP